jgi:diacylglycerol O-acyltransferase / wax synthase
LRHRLDTAARTMQQLSGNDAAYVYAETSSANANVSLIHIYDQSTAPGGKLRFKTLLAHIESRLDRSPVFRRKLKRVPLELDYPYWVEDEDFDLEYHVRHIALPKPGDWRQFCIQISRIHARPLDLDRPLWELYVIEGLDSFLDLPEGSFALLTKTHHAAVDIESGNELTTLLHDPTPTPPAPAPPAPWFAANPPSAVSMLSRGVLHNVAAPWRAAGPLARALTRFVPTAFTLAGDALLWPQQLPMTRFNSVVSPHRVFDTRRFTLEEFKAIRALVPGATVHDAVLAVCGGALRRYLDERGELPEASLTALTPFMTRDRQAPAPDDEADLSWLRVRLGTDIADPVERLRSVRAQTGASATVAQAIGMRELAALERQAPAATLAVTSKLLGSVARGAGRRAPLANCTITNVPGPGEPQYLCGARMTYFSALMPIADGMGLVFTVTSYDDRIVISPTSCRELMPDPEAFAQCIRDSFQEALAAARKAPPPRARKPPRKATTRASSSGKGSPRRLAA